MPGKSTSDGAVCCENAGKKTLIRTEKAARHVHGFGKKHVTLCQVTSYCAKKAG